VELADKEERKPDGPQTYCDHVFSLGTDNILWSLFWKTPSAYISSFIILAITLSALLAPLIAPFDPFNPAQVDLLDAGLPPAWIEGGDSRFLLGTDNQGRDILSAIMYGARISLLVGFDSVLFAMVIGVNIGLASGYVGGYTDVIIMRIADIQLSFPAILVALLIDGIVRILLPRDLHDQFGLYVIILAIAISGWVEFARTVRSSVMRERVKDYVLAAQIIGRGSVAIALRHILPNILGPIFVIATIQLALAIITESTLSFLGIGVSPITSSLGTLIRIGNEYLFSGEWWITIFPGLTLIVLALSVNILGDWLRDVFNPKLR
jgi:peptide/nickel transport system permease protein